MLLATGFSDYSTDETPELLSFEHDLTAIFVVIFYTILTHCLFAMMYVN